MRGLLDLKKVLIGFSPKSERGWIARKVGVKVEKKQPGRNKASTPAEGQIRVGGRVLGEKSSYFPMEGLTSPLFRCLV